MFRCRESDPRVRDRHGVREPTSRLQLLKDVAEPKVMGAERVFAYLIDFERQVSTSDQVAKPASAPSRLGIQLGSKLALPLRTQFGDFATDTRVPPERTKLI